MDQKICHSCHQKLRLGRLQRGKANNPGHIFLARRLTVLSGRKKKKKVGGYVETPIRFERIEEIFHLFFLPKKGSFVVMREERKRRGRWKVGTWNWFGFSLKKHEDYFS